MWQSDFDRRKDYLIRSLFQDIPLLSPVQEEDESFDSSRGVSPHPHHSWLPPARPYSPLPPLIIEVTKPVNHHDESEDFYIELEKKVLRVYRKLFIEAHSESCLNWSNYTTVDWRALYTKNNFTDYIDLSRNISSAMSSSDVEHEFLDDYDDGSENGSNNVNINIGEEIKEAIDADGNTETSFDSDEESEETPKRTGLKRRTSENDLKEKVESKKSKYNKSSSTDVSPKSSSKDECDETSISSNDDDGFQTEEEDIEERHNANNKEETYNYSAEDSSQSLEHIQVTFLADIHWAYHDEPNQPNDDLLLATNADFEMDDESGHDSANEEIVESLENNKVPANITISASDRGDFMRTPRIQPENIHDPDSENEEITGLLEYNRAPDNLIVPDREIELMRTPRIRPSVGSLHGDLADNSGDVTGAEQVHEPLLEENTETGSEATENNSMEHEIDFDFLNRTMEANSDGSESNSLLDNDASKYKDNGIQTSFDFEIDNQDVLMDAFYGQCKVLKLCRCRNHVCDS